MVVEVDSILPTLAVACLCLATCSRSRQHLWTRFAAAVAEHIGPGRKMAAADTAEAGRIAEIVRMSAEVCRMCLVLHPADSMRLLHRDRLLWMQHLHEILHPLLPVVSSQMPRRH